MQQSDTITGSSIKRRREATRSAYEVIRDKFLDPHIDRRGREAILLSLISEIADENLADISKGDEHRIKQAISNAMQSRVLVR